MRQYIVDAFTDRPFSGNPAAVCPLSAWLPEATLQKIALENNLSETAFFVKEGPGYRLRWFTPAAEEELCGHATLATAFVILTILDPEAPGVRFETRSGPLTVVRRGDLFEMNFPTFPLREVPVTDAMEKAFGVRPAKAVLGLDLNCIFKSEEEIRRMQPDQALLRKLPGRGQNVTAPGKEVDCVSRSFFPKDAIPEDPVCGSAHCQIAAYWAGVLGRRKIEAVQASARGGILHCRLTDNGRILISGEAVLERTEEAFF